MNVVVKVCGLTTAEDVAAAVNAGADAVGFVFAESPRRVTPEHAADISRHVPASVLKVAVMLHPSNEQWRAVAHTFAPDVLQTDAGDYAALEIADDLRCWPVFRQGTHEPGEPAPDEYVYEGPKSGQGETVDWARAAEFARDGRMILAGGLGPGNVAEAVRAVRPWGVDASSSLERAPGRKDAGKVTAYVAAAKGADNRV